jgi:hypothetical protein
MNPTPPTAAPTSMRRTPQLIAGLTIAALLVAGTVTALTFTIQSSRAFDYAHAVAAPTNALHVAAHNAAVNLAISHDNRVHVSAHGTYRHTTPTASLNSTPNTLTITGGCRDSDWLDSCQLTLNIQTPAALDVTVTDANAEITAEGLTHGAQLTTTNGHITATSITGSLTMRTTNAAIAATDLHCNRVDATSSNGNITLDDSEPATQLTAKTTNGSIDIRVPDNQYRITPTTTNGALNLSLPNHPDATHLITATTTNGAITITPN